MTWRRNIRGFVEQQSEEWRVQCAVVCRERAQKLGLLKRQRVRTITDLQSRLLGLSPSLKLFGIELIWILGIRQAIPVVLEVMLDQKSDRTVRLACANALYVLEAGKRTARALCRIGNRELKSDRPDRHWLEAVVLGLGVPDELRAIELLVAIFERVDLPGSVRGDAADKLGCVGHISDRRTGLFRRCRDAAAGTERRFRQYAVLEHVSHRFAVQRLSVAANVTRHGL
ncbi:MAG: hypothetical protein HY290_27435 [Planctomycetia bacterium]|nr:hypothetical protein [Planctomycetia bacterium]